MNHPNDAQQQQIGAGMPQGFQGVGLPGMDQMEVNPLSGFQINTLDQPVTATICRDLSMIGYKLKYVLMPKMREQQGKELRNWDLWGPLLLCLALALTLGVQAKQGTDSLFGTIFLIIWGGAIIVTLNAKMLGGKVSFLQSVCVLGYCIFPINLASILLMLLSGFLSFFIKMIIVGIAFAWSSFSSIGFMSSMIAQEQKAIAVYPIFLFYLFLSWFALFI